MKKSSKSNTVWVELGILPVCVGYAPTRADRKATIKELKLEWTPRIESRALCEWWVRAKGPDIILISIEGFEQHAMPQVAGMIAHECMHAFRYIKEIIGEKEPSSEFEAYMIQAMVQGVLYAHIENCEKPWAD